MTDNEFLEHAGVLGMKWGRRKNKSSNRLTPNSPTAGKKFQKFVKKAKSKWKKRSEERARLKAEADKPNDSVEVKTLLNNKRLSQLSNVEIKKINERLQLERSFKDLTKKEMSAGKKFVIDVLTTQAKEFANSYVKQQLAKALVKTN